MSEEKKTEEVKEVTKASTDESESRTENVGKEKSAPTGKHADLIKQVEKMSVLELSELVKALEDRFGVSASAPMMVAGAAPVAGAVAEVEEKDAFTIHLASSGDQKIAVIKAVREIRSDLGLKEAKDLVDGAPKDVKTDVPKAEAEAAKAKLEAAGAKVELK